jgi:hypothetical protein
MRNNKDVIGRKAAFRFGQTARTRRLLENTWRVNGSFEGGVETGSIFGR